MIKILIIGYGSAGQRLATGLSLDRDVMWEAWDIRDLKTFPYPEQYDAFIIATPTPKHVDYLLQLIPFGKPILVEKPAVMSIDEWRQVADVWNKYPYVFVAYQMRFLQKLQELKQEIDEEYFGDIIEVLVKYGHDITHWRRGAHGPYLRRDGILLEASHELDYLKWLFPNLRFGQAIKRIWEAKYGAKECQVLLNLHAGFPCHVSLNYMQPEYERWIRVVGTKRSMTCDFSPEEIGQASGDMIAEFVQFIRTQQPPPTLARLSQSFWILDLIAKVYEKDPTELVL